MKGKKEREGTEGREGFSRRQFIRAAEVAALSLFGVLGLDEVTERVAQCIAERRGIDRLAERVVQDLRKNGAAYAEGYCGSP